MFFGFNFAWLIGPGIFRGNCPLGSFKGEYAGRIGRQKWKSLNFCWYGIIFLFCSNAVGLIGPGVFRGNCPLGNFKGIYAGRIGRQN